MKLTLDCAICRQSADSDDIVPAQAEHLIDLWSRTHQHTQAERDAYEESLKDFRPKEGE